MPLGPLRRKMCPRQRQHQGRRRLDRPQRLKLRLQPVERPQCLKLQQLIQCSTPGLGAVTRLVGLALVPGQKAVGRRFAKNKCFSNRDVLGTSPANSSRSLLDRL